MGKFHGKTKLGKISPAAGATSPNKTVEGVLGGCAVSAGLGVLSKLLVPTKCVGWRVWETRISSCWLLSLSIAK